MNQSEKDKRSGETAKAVAARLRELRLAYNLRPVDIATKVGVARSSWALYESGDRRISIESAIKVCNAFLVTLDWIYRGDGGGVPARVLKRLAHPIKPWDLLKEDTADE